MIAHGRSYLTPSAVTAGDGCHVERLNEHSLEDCLGRPRATAIYIVGGWDCLSFNRLAPTLPALFAAEAFSDAVSTGPTDSTVIGSEHKDVSPRMLA